MRKTPIIASLMSFGAFALGAPNALADNQISAVTASESGDATVVTIAGTRTPTFTVYKLDRPARVVVDIARARMVGELDRGERKAIVNINSWAISSVSATARRARGNKLVRVVVSLARTASYKVKAQGNDLVITVRARAPKPPEGASPAELAAARAAAAKARAARRLADARAREATERAERQAVEMEKLKRNGAGAEAERQRRERAEARLAAALRATESAKKRAAAAEKAVARARRESREARAAAERRVKTARAEADKARAEARRASAAAAAQLTKAESEREEAAKRLSRANQLVAAARAEREAARRARVEATAREKAARTAIAAAKRQRAAASAVAARAAKAREKADRAVASGSSQAKELKARAEKVAAAAEKRRKAAEEAALVAEKRRREAETAARAARRREKSSTAEVAAAERRLAAADKARAEAEAARATAEKRSRELMAAIKEAKARARDAAARAEGYRKAARNAEKQAEEARTRRLAEERAFAAAARAKVKAIRERERAERAAAEVSGKLAALKRAEAELASRRAASTRAAADVARARRTSDRDRSEKMARIAEARSRELAAAARALAARRAELAASERKAAELEKARRVAAAEVAKLKRAAARARTIREREEARAARLDAKRGQADKLYREAEQRLAAAKRTSAEAEKARLAAEAELDQARAERLKAQRERAKASDERKRLHAARREAEADRNAAAADRAAARALRARANKRGQSRERARVNDVKFVDRSDVSRVVIGLSAPAAPKIVRNDGRAAVLEIAGVAIARDLERTLDTSAFSGPVKAVSSFRDPKNPKKVRLVVDLDRSAKGKLKKVGNTYYWDFPKRAGARRTARRSPARRRARTSHQKPRVASYGATSSSITQQTVAQLRPRRRRVYRGRRIDLNFKDADIHNLLRILATVGGVNIVVPQTVRGTVTVRLKSVPWDQAMEVILSSQGLWYRRSGSLIRVDKRDVLDKEDKEAAEAAAARIKSEPPEPEIFTLNYADANQVKGQLGPLLSPKGQIQIDQRTNALIVNDVAAHRRRIIDLASRLDTQTPQIQIEARVVEARTTFAREFGIQWGGNVAATPQGGNATGLIFPNSVQVAGAAEDGQTPNAGVAAVPSDFAVNLPAAIGTGSGGGLGISLGSVGGNFNINLRLSALEDTGTVRIISSPKITTSNNISAKIKSGVSIPVSVVSANGTQTQFVPADLSLDVTPSVSQRDCSISMKLTIKKNEADFANTGARGDPSIITKEAQTTILVADGETAVVGGIYTRNTGLNYSKVPFFAEIPVIGYFFKNRSENDERAETLLFVTPKITNRAFLRCQ